MDKFVYSLDGLEARLKAHTNVFNNLLDTIPPKFYIAEVNEKLASTILSANDYQKRKQTKVEAKKAKKAKLNPTNQLSVLEIQEAQHLKEKEENGVKKAKGTKNNQLATPTANKNKKEVKDTKAPVQIKVIKNDSDVDMNNADYDSDDSDDDDDGADILPVFSAGSINGEDSDAWMSSSDTEDISSNNLHHKPCRMNAIVKGEDDENAMANESFSSGILNSVNSSPGTSSIDALRDKLKARIGALREKRHIESETANSGEETTPKKELEKKKQGKKGGDGTAKETIFGESNQSNDTKSMDGVNMEGDFNFVRFQFGEQKRRVTRPEHALQKIEKNKEKLEQLKQEDPSKATELEDQVHWQRAVKLARGEKLRDDEQLLRKTIKRTAEQKKKSEKEWSERTKTIQDQKDQRQKKRNDNLQARIDSKKNKGSKKQQLKSKVKKTPQRPGFEGKSMNKKKKSAAPKRK
ncbi:surfeit locus protein 6-domain-containing protein [Syncephalis fuscata]|nr:surfeit locus protein 6-domain-containing protein [Syncephalis fuscata]